MVIVEYRHMLVLAKRGVMIVPSVDFDEIWHTHILHTKDFAADCQNFVGYFLHHSPGGDVDDKLQAQFDEMLVQYLDVFGETPPVQVWGKNGDCQNQCGIVGDCDLGCRG
jgi:hypothetical protein